MEVTEESEYKILQEFLTSNEIDQIPGEVCKNLEIKLQEKLDEFITAKAVFEAHRKNLDQKVNDLTKENESQKKELRDFIVKFELAEKYSSELQSQLGECRTELSRLQESMTRMEKEHSELRKQKDTLSDDNNMLHSQIERKDSELLRLRTELASLGSQLQEAISSKCQALTEIEEVRSREISLDFREKHMEHERGLLSQQVASLEEELSKRTTELQNFRADVSARAMLTNTRLSQCEEDLKIANESVAQLREANVTLQRRCEELTQKLEDQRNHELTMHSSYREEVTAQTRLADLYKGIADEANAKSNDYSNAVKELQNLLEHATEQYGILESKYNQTVADHNQQICDKQKTIEELSKELEMANELLKNIKQERLEQAVEELAPTAAIASRILKKGLSLTQIYTQYVEVTNDLRLEREENEKLKSQMEVILRELEDKAPVLQQQRDDYETALANVTTLSLRIDDLIMENNRLLENADESKRFANHQSRENQRLKSELADLARQVCYLLKEVQESRTGSNISNDDSNIRETDNLASSQIISKKLVTFKDIQGLQENNQKLLSIVRTLSSRQEEIEKATDQINSGEMKEKLDSYMEQLADMQAAQDRQSKMLEGLLKQRDMYKNMYQKCVNQGLSMNNSEKAEYNETQEKNVEFNDGKDKEPEEDENNKLEIKKWRRKFDDLETRFNQVNKDFEIYKGEKAAHEHMLNEEIERLRKDAENNSSRCCRLKAQLDSANERFNLVQGNITAYKAQIKILEEKCNNYLTTIGKHEQSLMILKDEALTAQSRLSKAEVQLENLRQERQLLRDSEGRLIKEREVLQRERHTHALLKADVEAIKASLERVQAEGQLRVEQRLDDATRECAALRRRLQEEQDRFRELSTNFERQLNTVQDQLSEEKSLTDRIQKELEASRLTEKDHIKRIEELSSQLKEASIPISSNSMTGDDNLHKKLKELELQLSTSQAEYKSVSDQLRAARFQCQQYCDIAESAEAQLQETTNEFKKLKDELDCKVNSVQDELKVSKTKIAELTDKLSKVSSGHQESDLELKEKIHEAEQKLEEFEMLKVQLEITKTDLQNTSAALTAAEEKYAREMVLHSNDLQILTKLKEENRTTAEKIAELTELERLAKETLLEERTMHANREKRLQEEMHELQQNIADLDAQNILLHNQFQEISERAVLLQSQQHSPGNSQNANVSIDTLNRSLNEEDSKSIDQLLQIIKYLRREKDLIMAKYDVLKSENTRLKSQVELAERRLQEMKEMLKNEREHSEIEMITTSKHADLLRKVETLNAITDSNRILREERDSLNEKIKDITNKLTLLSEEVVPLREKYRDLESKNEALVQENSSLKNEAMRWRQRANTLVERANKASPEDWRRLQTERENLSKLLTSERETHSKSTEELNTLKAEKVRLEEQLSQLQRKVQSQELNITTMSEDIRRVNEDLDKSIIELNEKTKGIENFKKELADKDILLADIKNKEIQIRKIAKKYKTQYEELSKTMEEKSRVDGSQMNQSAGNKAVTDAGAQTVPDRETQLKEEGSLELQQANMHLNSKVNDLTQQVLVMQDESENLKKEIEIINKTSLEKEERAKQVLKGARTKIMQLTEYKKLCEKEVHELKGKLDTSASECESTASEYEARLAALKSQMESRISRLEHERADLQAEKEALLQRATQLQRQLSGQNNPGTGTNEPPTANIKPMSARTETPLASIRPMSVVVQSRTAAVLPTTAGAPLLLTPQQSQQQLVHTTETSSPTSSHIDYQPASTSRQLLVQPQLNESAESTQREEPEVLEQLTVQQQQQQQQQCQQQTVALVSPRVEQQQQQQQQTVPNEQQTVPSSSTQSVSTSHTSISHKRPRTLDSPAMGSNLNETLDHNRQEQISSPKTKRSRPQDLTPSTPASATEIEYQVPTSSQRDQDEEVEDCVVVDCDEGGGTQQTQEDEEFDNDPYEEIEEEELPYSVEVEGDNNEVEIIMEEDTTNVEVPRQIQSGISTNQQQSEAISSAGPTGEPGFVSRSRGIVPIPRQQQQHLLLPQQGYEDGGDDCIVPCTPTLFVPRRNDGFGEAVSSPQIPQGRFTFGETPTVPSVPVAQSLATPPTSRSRAIFGSTSSGIAQVVEEGMDDTRVDLTQLEDNTSCSVPSTPLEASPNVDDHRSVTSGPIEEPINPLPASTESEINIEKGEKSVKPTIHVISTDEQQDDQAEIITESEIAAATDGPSSESSKQCDNTLRSASVEDTLATGTVSDLISEEGIDSDSKDENREAEASPSSNTRQRTMAAAAASTAGSVMPLRGGTARRSTRTTFRGARGARPTPIVWDQSTLRGQDIGRGHVSRGNSNESPRVRVSRGRRMRSKYPYNY